MTASSTAFPLRLGMTFWTAYWTKGGALKSGETNADKTLRGVALALGNRIHIGVLSVLGSIVFLLGFVILINMFTSPPESLVAKVRDVPSREPAGIVSVIGQKGIAIGDESKMAKASLGCLKENKTLLVKKSAKHFQVSGKYCGVGELDKIYIINRTNGIEGLGVKVKKNRFISDYVYLAEGSNKVFVNLKGPQEDQVTVLLTIDRE